MTFSPNQPFAGAGADQWTLQAMRVRADFDATCKAIRMDTRLSDLAVAQTITNAWTTANEQISALWQQLQTARRARIAVLGRTVPIGPNIPKDASPADAAVMQQAFRVALEKARAAAVVPDNYESATFTSTAREGYDPDTLSGMLLDAEKFDDDTLRRAVLTAAVDAGRGQIIRWWTDKMGISQQLDELARLESAVASHGFDGMWDHKAFDPLLKPEEVDELGRLEKGIEASTAARIQRTRGY